MAVDEACTNIIYYAYDGWEVPFTHPRTYDLKKEIDISLYSDAEKVGVIIFDSGRPFENFGSCNIDLDEHIDEMKTRGLGVHIIKNFVDEVNYKHILDRDNRLELVKNMG